MRYHRRLVALSVVFSCSALVALWGCSTPDNHPPLIGDCNGALCPPAQSQGAIGSSGGSDSGGGGNTDGAVDSGGTTDSGGGSLDSGGD